MTDILNPCRKSFEKWCEQESYDYHTKDEQGRYLYCEAAWLAYQHAWKSQEVHIKAYMDMGQEIQDELSKAEWALKDLQQREIPLSREVFGKRMAKSMFNTAPPVGEYEMASDRLKRYVDCAYKTYVSSPPVRESVAVKPICPECGNTELNTGHSYIGGDFYHCRCGATDIKFNSMEGGQS